MRPSLATQYDAPEWSRWPHQSQPQQQQPTEYHTIMATPPLMPFDSPQTSTTGECKHIVNTQSLGPSYMIPNQYQPGSSYEPQTRTAQYHQPMPFPYGQYSNPSPATPLTPPFEAQGPSRSDVRLLSPLDAHAHIQTRGRPSQYQGHASPPMIKPDSFQMSAAEQDNGDLDGPHKDVNPIRPDNPQEQIEFNTPIDNLMRRYQSLGNHQGSVSSPQLPTPVQSPRNTGARRIPTSARKTFQCGKCDYVSTQKAHLNAHKRTHTSERPYKCRFCDKKSSQKGNLEVHERSHLGLRVFKCEYPGCDSTGFFSRSNLVAHKKIHMSNRKKWVCKLEGCTKSFSSTGNRKAHHNKFHEAEFRRLSHLIDHYNQTGQCPSQDKMIVEELAIIYKNSNKGIKGRGKGVKIEKLPSGPQHTGPAAPADWNHKGHIMVEERPASMGSISQMLGPMYHKPEHPGALGMTYRGRDY